MFRKIIFGTDGFWDGFDDKNEVFHSFVNSGVETEQVYKCVDNLMQTAWKSWMQFDPCNIDSMTLLMMDINWMVEKKKFILPE